MSTIIEGVEPAATPAAPEPKTFSSFAEERASWTPEQRQKWDETGEEPQKPTEAAKPAETVVEKEPAPSKAKTEPSAGGGEEDQDQEPEYYGTPEQIKAQKHAFAKVKRERAEARAEAKILREQLAGKLAAPAAAPKAEPKPDGLEKPKRPVLPDPTDYDDPAAFKAALKKHDAEMDDYEEKLEAYREAKAERKQHETRAEQEKRERAQTWHSEVEAIKEEHGDEAVGSIMNLVVSLPMMGVLMGMKGGAKAYLHLAENPELAAELTKETDIPGNFQSYEELALAANDDPKLLRQLSAAEAVVRHEIRRILNGASKADPNPKRITVSRAPAPAEKVNANASVAKDPIADAWEKYDKTGDHKYLALANKLEDERDAKARRGT